MAVEKLGKGTYGTVYKAIKKYNYAIKKIKMDVDTKGIPSTALRVIAILKKIIHPNVIKIIDLAFSDKNIELWLDERIIDIQKEIKMLKK